MVKKAFGWLLIVAVVTFGGVFFTQRPEVLPAAGHVTSMQPGSTLYGVNQVMTGQMNTQVWMKEGLAILFWPTDTGGTAFVGFDTKTMRSVLSTVMNTGGKANLVSMETLGTFKANLTADGWKIVGVETLLARIGMGAEMFMAQYATTLRGMTTMIVLPVIIIATPDTSS